MFKVNQGSTARLSFLITDYDGAPIPVSNISTAVMSIIDIDTNTVIISGQNIKSGIGENGICTLFLSGNTNSIVTETKPYEKKAIIVVVSGVGASAPQITNETVYTVTNMKLI